MYEHRYKYGKQTEVLSVKQFAAQIEKAISLGMSPEKIAYAILSWHTGPRKSELYERKLEDIKILKELLIIDFGERKKGSAKTEPLEVPRSFYGIDKYVIPYFHSLNRKPTKKRVFFQAPTGEVKIWKNGSEHAVMKRTSRIEKAVWLFPHIASTTAWQIIKTILGKEYYPHYLKLRKLTAAGRTAKNYPDMIAAIKSISGLKTLPAIMAYLGSDKQVAKKAMRGSE